MSVHSTAAMAHASELDADMDRAREPVTDSGDAHAGVTAGEHTSSSSTSVVPFSTSGTQRQSSLLAQIDNLKKEQARLRAEKKKWRDA